ncbi:conserved hypothetical protein [Acinetobacter proteolyticus]|uniref:Uncharacterized protein n=1 Tax=Acinetobacter proteolyticus TaxID=1776741 RepID=A0A653K274_9GAMM|nr:conserved hypothetical protein [Acinetobacter proteolyticus]
MISYIYDILDRNYYKNVTSKIVFFFYNRTILQISIDTKL